MKINSSNVGMESARTYQRSVKTESRFKVVDSIVGATGSTVTMGNSMAEDGAEKFSATYTGKSDENLSLKVGNEDYFSNTLFGLRADKLRNVSRQNNTATSIKHLTLKYIMELLFGDKSKAKKEMPDSSIENRENYEGFESGGLMHFIVTDRENTMTISESETTSFSAMGTVVTGDGREINFNYSVTMSHSFTQTFSQSEHIEQMAFMDPLVINYDTDAAELSDMKFYFDLDCDGVKEELSQTVAGSGFLALDKNGDGIINDGNELFGAKSGNGFADLLQYDTDKNGWIDENDEVFSKLTVFSIDEEGNQKQIDLKEAGIGAIYLGSNGTQYTVSGGIDDVRGMVRRSGVFLHEDGTPGSLYQMDLAARSYA